MSIRNRFTSVLFYCISAEYERGMVKRSEPCKVCCHNKRGTLIVIRIIDSSLYVTVPFAVFPTQHFPTVRNDD